MIHGRSSAAVRPLGQRGDERERQLDRGHVEHPPRAPILSTGAWWRHSSSVGERSGQASRAPPDAPVQSRASYDEDAGEASTSMTMRPRLRRSPRISAARIAVHTGMVNSIAKRSRGAASRSRIPCILAPNAARCATRASRNRRVRSLPRPRRGRTAARGERRGCAGPGSRVAHGVEQFPQRRPP